MKPAFFGDRPCMLAEGRSGLPCARCFLLRHAGRRLFAREAQSVQEWRFSTMHSAAAWIDRDACRVAAVAR